MEGPYGILHGGSAFQIEFEGNIYESELITISYSGWKNVIRNNPNDTFYLYSVIESDNGNIIDLYDESYVFPQFAMVNPDVEYTYEYIQLPSHIIL